jgi:hypothetical protein
MADIPARAGLTALPGCGNMAPFRFQHNGEQS